MVIRDQVILAMPIAKRKVLDGQSFLLLVRLTSVKKFVALPTKQ